MSKKYKLGYTTGVFDLFHIGHLNIIKNAKSYCEELIVGVTTDELTEKRKNKRPIIPFEERSEIIRNLKQVDRVVAQDKIDEISDWKKYQFEVIFKGSDWQGTEKWNGLEEKFDQMSVDVIYFPYTKKTSSTKIREVLDSVHQSIND